VFEISQTDEFKAWLKNLADERAVKKIAQRIVRLQAGLMGDVKPVGGGLSELRIDYGPGYRVYFVQRGVVLMILLCGGDKKSQQKDIKLAKKLKDELEN
jgi:putative addiction module killer protein